MQSDKTKLFIEKARAIHGDRYGYSLVEYVRRKDKVKIICKEHGAFEQSCGNHLSGYNCKRCSAVDQQSANASNLSKAAISFIEKAKRKHGDKYCYKKSKYTGSKENITITCEEHGDFIQRPYSHLGGRGCPRCAWNAPKENSDFIAMANETHGVGKYSYAKVEYTHRLTPVTIICAEHGDFMQRPSNHVYGHGCPLCLWDRDQPTQLYILTNGKGQCKIGISIDPIRRIGEINKDNQMFKATLKTTWTLPNFSAAREIEQRMHKKLSIFNCGFNDFTGCTEWFEVSPAVAIKEITSVVSNSQQLALI